MGRLSLLLLYRVVCMCVWCFARAREAAAAAAKSKNSSKGFAGLQQHSRSHLSWSDFIKVIKGDFNYLRTRSHGRSCARCPCEKGFLLCSRSDRAVAGRPPPDPHRPTDRPAAGLIDSNLRIINKDFPVGILTTVRSVMSRAVLFLLYVCRYKQPKPPPQLFRATHWLKQAHLFS